jgi:1,4-alpha-glucan branching enzyme
MFPGKKLLFMGGEIGQSGEWDANGQVDWRLLEAGQYHAGIQTWMSDLNRLYGKHRALWDADYDAHGFAWVDCTDAEHSVFSFLRRSQDQCEQFLVILNLTPMPREHYRLGTPSPGHWREVLNSDAACYGGGNLGNGGGVFAESAPSHGLPYSASFLLPPLAAVIFQGGV